MPSLKDLVDKAKPPRSELLDFAQKIMNLERYHKPRSGAVPCEALHKLFEKYSLIQHREALRPKPLYDPYKGGSGRPKRIINK